jgi:RsiW-degrading membrane proteinase PrsW (M82 family)
MTNLPKYNAYLKLSGNYSGNQQHPLSTHETLVIGRDPNCGIVLDSHQYPGVSRRHIEISPVVDHHNNGLPQWQVRDLGSGNGSYVNQQKLVNYRILRSGDRIMLGGSGAEFLFELELINQPIPSPAVSGHKHPQSTLQLSQLLPILSSSNEVWKRTYLVPGIITVLLVVGLFLTIGRPVLFNTLLAIYLSLSGFYFIYQLSGKSKPWWLFVIVAISTIILLISPVLSLFVFLFRELLPGGLPQTNLLSAFVGNFFGAGLMEELLKAIPVFGCLLIGRTLKSPSRENIGVWEPLDGILLGAASGVGFTLLETLGQYVPNIVMNSGELSGIQLLIPRIIGSVAGHLAYSGYFGYFIGLSVLKPQKAPLILGIGYLTASIIHALWNTSATINPFLLPIAGIVSYVFLVAAILKARQLSPTK